MFIRNQSGDLILFLIRLDSLDYENIVWYWYQDASKEFYENVSTQTNLYLTDLNANKAGIYAYGISTNASNIYNVIYKLHVFSKSLILYFLLHFYLQKLKLFLICIYFCRQ